MEFNEGLKIIISGVFVILICFIIISFIVTLILKIGMKIRRYKDFLDKD